MSELVVGKKYRVKLVNGFDSERDDEGSRFGGKIVTLKEIIRFNPDGTPCPIDVYESVLDNPSEDEDLNPTQGWSFYRDELELV